MRTPSAAELIEVWERGRDQNAVERALTLLAAAEPLATSEELRALPIGERDRRLLQLRQALFGNALRAVWDCAQCREKLEFTLDVQELISRCPSPEDARPLELSHAGARVQLRRPNSEDLLALLRNTDPSATRRLIAQRCLISSAPPGDEVLEQVADSLATLDQDSDIVLALDCAACGHRANVFFDIAAFLWSEWQSLVRQLLEQVHALAWAYGWREQDILAMSAARRRFYLERVA